MNRAVARAHRFYVGASRSTNLDLFALDLGHSTRGQSHDIHLDQALLVRSPRPLSDRFETSEEMLTRCVYKLDVQQSDLLLLVHLA